jgi:hypothetical protein
MSASTCNPSPWPHPSTRRPSACPRLERPPTDASRTKFRPGCFRSIDVSKVKLRLRHDRVVGSIDSLEVDDRNRILVTATVTDVEAMIQPAMSVGVAVHRFSLKNEASPSTFYGEVEDATVEEFSLLSQPANRRCLVLERWVQTPVDRSFQVMLDKLKDLQATVQQQRRAA